MIGRLITRRCGQFIRSTGTGVVLSNEASSALSVLRMPVSQTSVPLVNHIRGSHHEHWSVVQVQRPAPLFKGTAVVNGDFKDIDICDFRGQYLVLFFYPLDFTFVCPTEIIAFSDRIDEFNAINTAVVGVSCDSHFSHLAWINTPRKHGGLGDLKYPLLSDFNKTIARDYNVLLEAEGVPLRGLFIIDHQGVVRQMTVNDLPVGRSVDEVLRLVRAFQFTDKHGEEDSKDRKQLETKFSVPNIVQKSNYSKRTEQPAIEETEETKGLTTGQLERLVLVDQLKYYRMQIEDLEARKEEIKRHEKATAHLLHERDCIAV